MAKRIARSLFVLTILSVLVLSACDVVAPVEETPAVGETKTFTVTATVATAEIGSHGTSSSRTLTQTPTLYYSLSTGAEVTGADIASNKWDIAFGQGTQSIRTNSGVTATDLSTGGQGGVWYAGTTDFDGLQSAGSADFSGQYATDTVAYRQNGVTTATVEQFVFNTLTYIGYDGGDGSAANPYSYADGTPAYDKDAWYTYGASGVVVSSKVYVIKHGDGSKKSKLQITEFALGTSTPATRTYSVKYATFN